MRLHARSIAVTLCLLLAAGVALAVQERLAPDAILLNTGWNGTVTDIQDDPDSPDGNWLTHDGATNNKTLRVSFPTPANPLTDGAGLQEFRVLLRKVTSAGVPDAGGGAPPYTVELWENGLQIATLASGSIAGGPEVVSGTWDATGRDATQIECVVTTSRNGGGASTRHAEVGAVEWNAETTVAGNTTTLGDGTDPAAAPSLCPGGPATMLDAFSFVTDGNSDQVNDVTVDLTNGTAESLALVEVTSENGATVYGSVAAPVPDPVTINLTTNTLTATASLTEYRVRITPKAHADMPAPQGTEYAVQGTVTTFTPATNTTAGSDADSDTVTIDNHSPDNPGGFNGTAGDNQVELSWTDPVDADFIEVIIVRKQGGALVGGPTEGQTYAVTDTVGDGTVVFVGTDASSPWTDGGVVNGNSYWYKIFARDDPCANWSTGAETGPHTPTAAGNTTTLGDGTDPAAAPSLCPGGPATMLDAFSFVTDGNSDQVNDVTVDLTNGTAESLALVEVTSENGATVYGSVAAPVPDPVTVNLTTNTLTATTTLTEYRVRITPKAHADMPAPQGTEYAVLGTVTAYTPATNSTGGSDVDSDTVTIDNRSPDNPSGFSGTAGDGQVDLSWTDPADADFLEVILVRKQGGALVGGPTEGQTYAVNDPVGDGTVVFVGTDVSSPWTDAGVVNGNSYWYEVFARDDPCANWSTGAQTGPHTPAAARNDVIPNPATANVDGCNQITVTATFAGDDNNDSSTTFRRGPSGTGPWTDVCVGVTGPSPRTCIDSGVSESSTYWYQVEFSDGDGVDTTNAANPQEIGPFNTPACSTDDTTAFSNTAEGSSCKQITVIGVFQGDADGDGWTLVEHGTSATGPWTTACARLTGASPRECLVTGDSDNTLTGDTWVQITYEDPDGVPATNSEVLGPINLDCSGAADTDAPTVLLLSPTRDAVVSGVDRAKVLIYEASGISTVRWAIDNDPLTTCAGPECTENTNYQGTNFCGTDCTVYEIELDTSGLANDRHRLTVEVTDASAEANVARIGQAFRSSNTSPTEPGGGGLLLRRSHGSQLCNDCHNMATHSSQTTSGDYGNWALECLTCHTPHDTQNIYLVQKSLRTPNSGTTTVNFHYDDAVVGTYGGNGNPGDLPAQNPDELSFLGDRSQTGATEPNAPYDDGICEACHTKTKFWRNTETVGKHGHNAATRCTECHLHDQGFKPTGGGCRGCHGNAGDPGVGGTNSRRAVLADFTKTSHHVGDGTTSMGGSLTDHDCVVCHAEGRVNPGSGDTETVAIYHGGDGGTISIDLKDADNWDNSDPTNTSVSVVYSYDKNAVASSAGVAENWNSGDATWVSQTSTALDPFCLTCHDANGALQSRNETDTECTPGGDASNPFCDGAITNEYDQWNRGRVTDIASRAAEAWRVAEFCSVSGDPCVSDADCPSGQTCDPSSYTAQERDQAGQPRYDEACPGGAGCNIEDPPQGTYARHAIRGTTVTGGISGSASVYSGTNATWDTATYWDYTYVTWASNAVMGCADCHTTDGANTTDGNAHGSNSEYLLKDGDGLAREGDEEPETGEGPYNCYLCHQRTWYDSSTNTHTGNTSDYFDTTDLTGAGPDAGRVPEGQPGGNLYGIACLNCHGGVRAMEVDPDPASPPDFSTPQFGTIHGTSQIFRTGEDGSGNDSKGTPLASPTRQAYRFTNGNSLRYFDPQTWSASSATCYTLSGSKGDQGGDEFGGCTKHGGGQSFTRPVVRNLNY